MCSMCHNIHQYLFAIISFQIHICVQLLNAQALCDGFHLLFILLSYLYQRKLGASPRMILATIDLQIILLCVSHV